MSIQANRFEITKSDDEYPELLLQIEDPPEVLYGLGDPSALAAGLAVVGARRATPYGLRAATALSGWAAGAGYTVVSGGAVGCDQAAHRAALDASGITVAVFAGGPDIAYPKGATRLFNEITREGAVVSEVPWGTEPRPWMFRKRNRLIAGLSAAVLVVEAGLPSGTLSTVDYALDACREVLSVPGSIFSPTSRGCNRLFLQGAIPITDVSDLRDALVPLLGPPASEVAAASLDGVDTRDRLAVALRSNPMRLDDVALCLNLDVVTVLRRAGDLEARGIVRRYPDGRYGP